VTFGSADRDHAVDRRRRRGPVVAQRQQEIDGFSGIEDAVRIADRAAVVVVVDAHRLQVHVRARRTGHGNRAQERPHAAAAHRDIDRARRFGPNASVTRPSAAVVPT
jgi:hypothetical protein